MSISDAPIMVCGFVRSGTTWMQTFLSQHPRIHIHGQIPNLPWRVTWNWYNTLIKQGKWAQRANRAVGYAVPHYAGSDPERCREVFKQMYRDFMTGLGPRKERWGLKALTYCANPQLVRQFESIWPEARWVVCIRDPFAAIESNKNTFSPQANPVTNATTWVQACKFVDSHDVDRVATYQVDKLKDEPVGKRRKKLNQLLSSIGEEPSAETDEFIERWPVIHKVKPDKRRKFKFADATIRQLLNDVPDLAYYLEKWGYEPRC